MSKAERIRESAFKLPIRTEGKLRLFVERSLGLRIPNVKICEDHSTPWQVFRDAYFAKDSIMVLEGSRGFAGKSMLLAALSYTEAATLGCDVNLLGGSGQQSSNVKEYMGQFIRRATAPRYENGKPVCAEPTTYEIKFELGNVVRALMASQTSVRGPHPERLRMDECDEMPMEIFDAALGQTMDRNGVAAQTILSSTHQWPDGTFSQILKRAQEADPPWPVHKICFRENLEPHGWLTQEMVNKKKREMSAAAWRSEVELQEPNPEDRAIFTEFVEQCFKKELGEYDDRDGEYIEIEAPVREGEYAHGADWGRKVDFSCIVTLRTDIKPVRIVAYRRGQRRPWPILAGWLDSQIERYGDAVSKRAHDACVDSETEILTKRGWLRHNQLVANSDEALAINPDTQEAEWQTIEYIYAAHRNRKMISMESARHSSLTTSDHKWLSTPKRSLWHKAKPIRWKTTETLSTTDRISTAAPVKDLPTERKYSNDFVELLAWFWTEGWSVKRGVEPAYHFCGGISQSFVSSKCDRIRQLLTRLYGPGSEKMTSRNLAKQKRWREELRKENVATFWLSSQILRELYELAPRKVIRPAFLLALTLEQLNLFIATSVDGDGTRNCHGRSECMETVIFQKDKERLDAFLMACALAGKATHTILRTWDDYSPFVKPRVTDARLKKDPTQTSYVSTILNRGCVNPVRSAKRSKDENRDGFAIKEIDYDGMIWCPHLKHHNWLARRNGSVYFTGNTGIGDPVKGYLKHDVEDVVLSGRNRVELFNGWIMAIESSEIEGPRIKTMYNEHKFVGRGIFSDGEHPPDTFVAGALAWHAKKQVRGSWRPL
jgi:hypothetical protein